jgi:hypothetical protein
MKKQQEVEQVERGKETITLECILTDDEKLKYSKTIAESVSKKARAENTVQWSADWCLTSKQKQRIGFGLIREKSVEQFHLMNLIIRNQFH